MNVFWFLIIFLAGEVVSNTIFAVLNNRMSSEKQWFQLSALIKGMLERLLLFLGLVMNYPQIIIAFGAFKLGTRLHDEKEPEISNSYFLIGNFISLLFVLFYVLIYSHLV